MSGMAAERNLATAFAGIDRHVASRDVARLADALIVWNAANESVYLDAGEKLRSVHGRISQIREGIGRTTELFGGPGMEDMRSGLAGAATAAESIEALSADRSATLASLHSALDGAAAGGAAVRLVFRMLDYVVLIARAQVEGMKTGQDELVPFTLHVDELVNTGQEVAKFIDERISLLARHLDESRAIEAQASAVVGGAEMMEGFIRLAERIEAQQRSAALGHEEAHRVFTEVWRAVAGVVMGLQFHDMARQRLEHTIRNLGIMGHIEEDGLVEDGEAPLTPDLRPAAVRRIAILEIAQLTGLSADYRKKMEVIDADLAAIVHGLDECDGMMRSLSATDAKNDGLAMLDAEVAGLRSSFRDGGKIRARLGESLERCVVATSALIEMTERLSDLEHDLRIAGLNAAVRAAHVDSGDDTIGYIARVIREQASQAGLEADKVRSGIEQAVAVTGKLSRDILPAIAMAENAIEERLTKATALVADVESECAQALKAIMVIAEGLTGEIAAVRDLMRPHDESGAMMEALSAMLAAIAAAVPEAELPAEEAGRLDRVLSASYTMEEERVVFASALGMPAEVPPASAAVGEGDDFDDILF